MISGQYQNIQDEIFHESSKMGKFVVDLTKIQLMILRERLPTGYSIELIKQQKQQKQKKKFHTITEKSQQHIQKKKIKNFIGTQSENNNQNYYQIFNSEQTLSNLSAQQGVRNLRQNRNSNRFSQFDDPYVMMNKQLKNQPEFLKQCYRIVQILKSNPNAKYFAEPVNVEAWNIPDYYDIIKEPMDLGLVERRIMNNIYKNPQEFKDDVKKIWDNAMLYNPKHSIVYSQAFKLSQLFDKLCKPKKSKQPYSQEGQGDISEIEKKLQKLQAEVNNMYNKGNKKGRKKNQGVINQNAMTMEEKKQLGNKIRQLDPQHLRGIWDIISNGKLVEEEEVEFDINELSNQQLWELDRYVQSKQRNQKKQVHIHHNTDYLENHSHHQQNQSYSQGLGESIHQEDFIKKNQNLNDNLNNEIQAAHSTESSFISDSSSNDML